MSFQRQRIITALTILLLLFLSSLLSHAQTFAVQVGAYHEDSNVNAMHDHLSTLDYTVIKEQIKQGNGKTLTQVAVGPLSDREEAALTLNRLQTAGFDGFIRHMPSPVLLAQNATNEETPPRENALNYFADGIEALDVQDFEAAAQSFKQAMAIEPENLEFQYHLAVAYVRLKRDQEALNIFESLIKEDPELYFKAYFDIAGVYSRQGDFQKALNTLDRAEQADPNNARVYLEKGYVYKNLKEYDRSIMSFSRAKELNPKETQLAYYMIGAVDLEREEFDNADLMFKKAIEISPETPLAQNAKQTLPSVEQAAWARKPWYLTTALNWGYDDNVPRNPIDELTGGPVSGGLGVGDQFQTFFLTGGYKFLNRKDMEIGVGYSLFSLGYRDWTQNNVTSHSPHAYFQGNFDPVYLRFQYDFSYFYAGGKKQALNPPVYLTFANNSFAKMRMNSFMQTISILEPYNLRSDINLSYQMKTYLDGTADASRYAGDITQTYNFPDTEIYPRIGYRYAHEPSDDKRAVYSYHEIFAGLSTPIYWGITGDVSFSYMRTDYPEFGPTFSTKRLDQTYTVAVTLNRYLIDHLLLTFNFLHIKNDSDYVAPPNPYSTNPHTFQKNIYLLAIVYSF